jgi:hypothetical protein
VKAGGGFEVGVEYQGILQGYQVEFAHRKEGGRQLLRLILPDPSGRTSLLEIGSPYSRQWDL